MILNVVDPGARLAILLVIGRDARLLLQRQLDFVDPFEQRLAPPRRNGEWLCFATRDDDLLSLQIDRQLPIWRIRLDRGCQFDNRVFLERLFDRYNGVPQLIAFDQGVRRHGRGLHEPKPG